MLADANVVTLLCHADQLNAATLKARAGRRRSQSRRGTTYHSVWRGTDRRVDTTTSLFPLLPYPEHRGVVRRSVETAAMHHLIDHWDRVERTRPSSGDELSRCPHLLLEITRSLLSADSPRKRKHQAISSGAADAKQ